MKKLTVTIILLAALLISAILLWAYIQNVNEAEQQNAEQAKLRLPSTDSSTSESSSAKGKYVDYSSSVIANTSGTKVLFFHAPWCPQCRAIEADIKKSGVPNGITIIKTDYDSNQKLRQKYGVTLQTTFVLVNDSGELVDKYVAYNEPTFESVKTNLLETN